MKEKILAIVITSIIVSVILIIIFTISSIKEKSRNGEKVNFVDEVKEFDLGTLAWVIILVMLVCIISLLIGYLI